ncbi:MAG: FG-GAP repeat domain-containing protein [Kiritimatiellia bacterium]
MRIKAKISSRRHLARAVFALALLLGALPAHGYIRVSYSLGRISSESTYITVVRISEVQLSNNVITFRKVRDLRGKYPSETIRHNIGKNGEFSLQGKGAPGTFIGEGARDWRDIMDWAQIGKEAVLFWSGGPCEVCIGNYWYQVVPEGGDWRLLHSEPTFALGFAGRLPSLIKAVEAMQAGQEAIVPCMVPSDPKVLLERTARIQRMKVSLKILDYNPQRDFAGWSDSGQLRPVSGMPGFTHYGALGMLGPGATGMAPADFTGDGKPDLCLFSEQRVVLLENQDGNFNECGAPIDGGARSAAWGDCNGDGRPDLLLATPSGVRLLGNQGGGKFFDCSSALPTSAYQHVTAAVWIGGGTNNARPNILLADGFRGLRLYRNKTTQPAAAPAAAPPIGKWFYAGPFDNTGGNGFATAYPPEKGVDLAAQYTGKGGTKVSWQEGSFTDGQVNNLALFQPENNENAIVYLYRELQCKDSRDLPVSMGSDDTLSVWFNGQPVHAENVARGCQPDQVLLTLKTKPGRNSLLLKICQGSGPWAFYFSQKLAVEVMQSTWPVFEDVSDTVGLGMGGAASKLKGDQLLVADVNGDGLEDVLFSAGAGVLLIQTKQGFVEAPNHGISYRAGGVIPAFGDCTGDGRPDLFVPQAGGPGRLFLNDGTGHFRDVSERAGDLATPLGFATCAVWSDFCQRGLPDLLVGCVRGPNRYFRNNGNGTFTDAGDEIGLYNGIYNTSSLAVLDVNQDGVTDLIMGNTGSESSLLLGSRRRLDAPPAGKIGDVRKGTVAYAATAAR